MSRKLIKGDFLSSMTKWDGLLFLFNIPFLVILFVPNEHHTVKVIIATMVAVVGMAATTIASHTGRTSYTTRARRVWPKFSETDSKKNSIFVKIPFFKKVGPCDYPKCNKLREFYENTVETLINTSPTLTDNQKKMLKEKSDWNDTQMEKFIEWCDRYSTTRPIETDDVIKDMMRAKEVASKDSRSPILIFGVIFAFIAGWAITNAVLTFSTTMDSDQNWHHANFLSYSLKEILLQGEPITYGNLLIFLSFFPIAIVFYHSGAIFLSSKASSLITAGDRGRTLVNFLVILFNGILLYLMSDRAAVYQQATSNQIQIDNSGPFVSLVIILMIISIVWVIAFRYLDVKDTSRDYPIYMEWLHLDMFVLLFCVIFLQSGAYLITTSAIPYLCMFFVFTSMAICSYIFAWAKIWGTFQATD